MAFKDQIAIITARRRHRRELARCWPPGRGSDARPPARTDRFAVAEMRKTAASRKSSAADVGDRDATVLAIRDLAARSVVRSICSSPTTGSRSRRCSPDPMNVG